MRELCDGAWHMNNNMIRLGDATSSIERCVHLTYFDPAEGAVPNPGMGVNCYVYSDHMHTGYTSAEWSATERLLSSPLDRPSYDAMVGLPHADNLYIRVEWRDIQKEPGRLELPTAWQWLMETVEAKEKRWSFRVMNCSPHSIHAHSLPDFLDNRIPMVPYWLNGKMPGPDLKYYARYTNEYLKWWNELLFLLGEAFDDHPLLEFTDVSGFGLWGEGHHYASHAPDGPVINYQCEPADRMNDVVKQLIDGHLLAFKKTPAVLSMHLTEYEAGRKAIEEGSCWLRRDSFMPIFSTGEADAANHMGKNGAMLWETIRPGCDDFYPGKAPDQFFMDLPRRYFDLGAHYAAIGFNPWDALYAASHYPELFEKLEYRLGYRIRPAIIWRRSQQDGRQQIVISLVNDGCSNPPGALMIQIDFPDGSSSTLTLPDNTPETGGMHYIQFDLPSDCRATGPEEKIYMQMNILIKGKTSPVRWAVKAEQSSDPFRFQVSLYSI